LGADVRYVEVKAACSIGIHDRSWNLGAFKPFWDSHGCKGKHFYFAFDLGTFPDDVLWVRFADGQRYKMPLALASYVQSLDLEMIGTKEQ
jgi:hypothetical protein